MGSCDSVNRGLTLVRFRFEETFTCGTDNDRFVHIKNLLWNYIKSFLFSFFNLDDLAFAYHQLIKLRVL